jgi:lipid-A-disaccharide synthase
VSELLVVSGEASGDRAAAAVLDQLGRPASFGLGGAASAAAGAELVGDMRDWTALGVGEAALRGGRVWQAWRAVIRAAHKRQPSAALLVNYTEFNARLAPRLHARGVRVLWYGAPQVWAWRAGRVAALRPSIDRLAVMLPFEEELWRRAGVDAHYVGHPALEVPSQERAVARETLGLTPLAATVALLPGSRPHEVRNLLVPMLEGYETVRNDRASVDARVLVASSLDPATRAWLHETCASRGVETFDVDPREGAGAVLRAFDVALCASGTASLEAALARAIPIVAYRVGLVTELTARAFVRTPHVALPNVLLGRRAFPELLQRDACAPRIAIALADVLDRRGALLADCDAVEACLLKASYPSRQVARMLAPWLGAGARAA